MWPEQILFMGLVGLGAIALLVGLIALLIGVVSRTAFLRNLGFGSLGLGAVCWGLPVLWYGLVIPAQEAREEDTFVGTWEATLVDPTTASVEIHTLVLREDRTFHLDETPGIDTPCEGRWRIGVDGYLIFTREESPAISAAVASPERTVDGTTLVIVFPQDADGVRFVRVTEHPGPVSRPSGLPRSEN